MQYERKGDIEDTVYSLCYDYFSSDTFNKIPELVSYRSIKGLQPLISNKLLCERYANYHIQIRHLQFRRFFFFLLCFFCIKFITFISEGEKNLIEISKL